MVSSRLGDGFAPPGEQRGECHTRRKNVTCTCDNVTRVEVAIRLRVAVVVFLPLPLSLRPPSLRPPVVIGVEVA